ncbi:MAG: T9SS type A sorting domain-containing protein [Bacteroidales bacterium]|nr:T9SS type A sorting domain-containing protein [Bacteroidales bacterium]
MKKLLLFIWPKVISCILILLITPVLIFSQPPTEEEILASIDLGLTWLVANQHDDGSWYDLAGIPDHVAHTGFALTKLCDKAYEDYYDSPFNPDYEYSQNVIDGFNYLFSQAKDDKIGIYICQAGSWHETYNVSIALMALAASYTPDRIIVSGNDVVNGKTYAEVVDQMLIYFEWGQNDDDPLGNEYGGWGYGPNYIHWDNTPYSDNSHTGYVVLGLRYAEAFGATIPQSIKDKLTFWVDFIQNDENGGSGYEEPNNMVNSLKTGNLLFEMAFLGDDLGNDRVQNALGFIETHWNDPFTGPPFDMGWQTHIQAMYCLMKGFESYSIGYINDGTNMINWYEAFTTYLVDAQFPDGAWPVGFFYGDNLVNTCWALFILEKVAPPPPVMLVDFDIHPASWPNPININSAGKVPTAILGTESFDITTIDPATLLLEGVAPVMWSIEDVTVPVEGEGECNNTEEGPDGFYDLIVKFNTQELVTALGEVSDGDELILTITGNLIDGQYIEGNDCIIIIDNQPKNSEITTSDVPADFNLAQNYPNPFNSITSIKFELPKDTHVLLKVFDIVGNEMTTLVNQDYLAGYHSVEFDAYKLANGLYFYRLYTADYTNTKQMLLIE